MTDSLKILVAGRAGQVARALADIALPDGLELVAMGRPDLDILDAASIDAAMDRVAPGLVINTAVDQAESDAANAHALNADAAVLLARAAARRGAPILHLSTDYVFDGTKQAPYAETDPVAPLGVYGRSKLAGERGVAEANPAHVILRTAWVYSPYGKNFVKTMLRVAESRDELGVVDDQRGNPTSAVDIAAGMIVIADAYRRDPANLATGTYHMCSSGEGTWADLAEQVFAVSASLGGPSAWVKRISSAEYPTPVTRPVNSRLDCGKILDTFNIRLPDWHDSSRTCVERLIATREWTS